MPRSLALILFLASLLLLCPNSAQASVWTAGSSCQAGGLTAGGGGTTSVNCSLTLTANTLIVAVGINCWDNSAAANCQGVTTSSGIVTSPHLTWNLALTEGPFPCHQTSGTCTINVYYALTGATTGSETITYTIGGSAAETFLDVKQFSTPSATPLDVTAFNSGSPGTNPQSSGFATTTGNNDLLIGVMVKVDPGNTNSVASGWTQFFGGAAHSRSIEEYRESGAAGSNADAEAIATNLCCHYGLAMISFVCNGCAATPPPPPPTGQFIRGVWFLDGSAGSTGGGGGGGTGGGGTEDLMDWVVMDARRTNHLTPGYSAHYLFGDTVATATAGTNFAWIKNSGGNPWDINHFDNRNISFWITENGEQAPTNASAYKRFISPVPIAPRYFTPGSTVTITTDGNNPIIRTINCEADNQAAINIGHIKGVTTGPASTAWGGDVGTADTITVNYYWGGTGTTYNTREREFLVKGFGRVGWDTAHWNGSSYVIDDATTHNTLALGASPDPNFACGYTSGWWQLVNGTVGTNPNPLSITTISPLPNASFAPYSVTLKSAGGVPPYSWAVSSGSTPTGLTLQTTGTLDGTPTVAGTSTFTAQVTDSVAATFSKAFSITVIDSTTHSVDLSWSASGGATSYNAYRATVNGVCSPSIISGCSKIGTGITQTTWSDANVTSGQHYFYVVTAVNSAGESGPSNQISITIP